MQRAAVVLGAILLSAALAGTCGGFSGATSADDTGRRLRRLILRMGLVDRHGG